MSGKTGTTEANRSSAFLGFTNQLAAASYIYDDSTNPSELCSFPLRQCGSDGRLADPGRSDDDDEGSPAHPCHVRMSSGIESR